MVWNISQFSRNFTVIIFIYYCFNFYPLQCIAFLICPLFFPIKFAVNLQKRLVTYFR